MNNLDAAKESGAILSCLARHRLAGSEKHFSQFRHHSLDVHQLEHVLRENGDEKAIQRRFPRLTPLESPPRVSRGIRQLVSEGVGIVLVDTKLHKKPDEQGTKTASTHTRERCPSVQELRCRRHCEDGGDLRLQQTAPPSLWVPEPVRIPASARESPDLHATQSGASVELAGPASR